MKGRTWSGVLGMVTMVSVLAMGGPQPGWGATGSGQTAVLQADANGLMNNVEEMMAHGGMGDARAIVSHCREASQIAGAMLARLGSSEPGAQEARTALEEILHQCRRVSERGVHADPGALLNPAIKARAAARDVLKALGLTWSRRS